MRVGTELSDGPAVLGKVSGCSDIFDVRLDNRSARRDWLLDGTFRGTSVDRWRVRERAEDKLGGNGGTGGTRESIPDSGEWTISPPLILLSLQYGDIRSPVSLAPGRVAESCRGIVLPLLYRFLPGLSLDRMKELAISARARVVPEMADDSSVCETAEEGLVVPGCKVLDGSWAAPGNSTPVSLRLEWWVDAERCIWTFDGRLGILIGAGAGFRDRGGVVALNGDDGKVRVNVLTVSVKQKTTYIVPWVNWGGRFVCRQWRQGRTRGRFKLDGTLLRS